jgi:hypothetical protein
VLLRPRIAVDTPELVREYAEDETPELLRPYVVVDIVEAPELLRPYVFKDILVEQMSRSFAPNIAKLHYLLLKIQHLRKGGKG